MTPPPCKCPHLEQIIVWVRGHREPEKQRHDRCIHPTGPNTMLCDVLRWNAAAIRARGDA